MGRQEIGSSRALAKLTGMNHATLNSRLNMSRSGERIPLAVDELWRIAQVLGVSPADLVHRASLAARTAPASGGDTETKRRYAAGYDSAAQRERRGGANRDESA